MELERSVQAVEKIFKLFLRIPLIIGQKNNGSSSSNSDGAEIESANGINSATAWSMYWLPVVSGLSQQCYHRLPEVRQISLIYLQRSLLLPELAKGLSPELWAECFDLVLFPLLQALLRPEIQELDGMAETRIRAAALVSRIFLQNLGRLHDWPGLADIWMHLLETLEVYYKHATSELFVSIVLHIVSYRIISYF